MPIRKLPPTIRQIPEVSDAWHHHHAETLSDHENRLRNLESGSHNTLLHTLALMVKPVKTPFGELPLPLAITAGGFIVWKYPDAVLRLLGQ